MRSKTITQSFSAKHTQSKSSFFAYLHPISSLEQAKDLLQTARAKHKADHLPFAYHLTLIDENNKPQEIERHSDDGEPSHTAGSPLATLLQQHKLTNCLLLVARVFGGVKLGTSGLTKAFREAGKLALEQATVKDFIPAKLLVLHLSPTQVGLVESFAKKNTLSYSFTKQNNIITCTISIPLEKSSLLSEVERLINK